MDILTEILFPAVDEAKSTIAAAAALEKRGDATLFGDGGLDSMGLVQFIVLAEEKIEDETGHEVRLATDKAMSRKNSPFASLDALAAFIEECLQEAAGE